MNRPSGVTSNQVSMEASVQKSKVQSDVRGSINARAEMAVADFFHSDGIAFSAVESPRFIAMCKALRFVADDFKVPNRHKLGKELLDINFNSCCESNIRELMKEGFVFGSTFLGDGATIGRMPLVNILGIVAEVPPVVIAIDDCTGKYSLFP